VAFALEMDVKEFLTGMQREIQSVMASVGHLKAAMKVPQVVDKVVEVALSDEGDTKDRELALRLGGAIDEKGSPIQINVNQQTAVVLKGDKDRMKAPLLQFSETVEEIDEEVRSNNVQSQDNR
jgi:hypothetical protein